VLHFDPQNSTARRAASATLVLFLGAGCSGTGAATQRPAAPVRATTARVPSASASVSASASGDLPASGWGPVTSLRFSLVLKLPDRHSWQVDDQTSRWLTLRHRPSDSELRVRTWAAARLVRPEECEQQARLWRPEIPDPGGHTALDQRRLDKPSGYTTRAVAGVRPLGHTGELEGFALAFGATIGRCYAFVYTTRARGAGADNAIADRLAVVMDGILPAVQARSIADRVH
jgi:hypothetical protein